MNILASHFDETKPFIDPPLNAQDIVVENPMTYSCKVGHSRIVTEGILFCGVSLLYN